MGRTRQDGMFGAVFMAATAIVACTSFDAAPGSPPASVPDDAGAPDGAGAGDGGGAVSTTPCAPLQCPTDAIFCEGFETWPIEPSSGWVAQGMVSPVEECTGTAMAGSVPASSSKDARSARVVRRLDADRRELFLDLDTWVEPKGAFMKSGFGAIVSISAFEGSTSRGFVGLSFGVDGLATVVRSVGAGGNRDIPTTIPHATWVHVSLHVKFDETDGLVEVAFDGKTVTSLFGAKTLAGSLDGFSLEIGALTDEDSTPDLTVKVDNVVLR